MFSSNLKGLLEDTIRVNRMVQQNKTYYSTGSKKGIRTWTRPQSTTTTRRFRRKLSTSARSRLRQKLAVHQQYPTTAECQENWEPPQTTDPEIIQAMEPERPELLVGG